MSELKHCPPTFPRHSMRLLLFCVFLNLIAARGDVVDELIATRMRERDIPGLSLAIIAEGKIVKEKGYGLTDRTSQAAVTPATLFQAGSVSKSVAAVGALRLVEEKRLSLDADVNGFLRSWKLPENEFTREKKVTLRGLLSHSAGLTVHGFPGYAVDGKIPTLVQVLDGARPANTPAVRVDMVPGSKWRYSGGGYTVMQQMVVDVTGRPFPDFMREAVLSPLGMSSSSYEQPLPAELAGRAATGHYTSGKAVRGQWHLYPEMAAAGLWTTASDLARFALGVEQAFAGESNRVLSQSMTRQMLTAQKSNDGLGVFLEGAGRTLRFSHGGRDEGFDSFIVAYAGAKKGAVILINCNDDTGVTKELVNVIAKEYRW